MITVEQLAANPRLATELPPAERQRLARVAAIAGKAIELADLMDAPAASPAPTGPETLLSLDEAAARLNVKKSRLAVAVRRGDVPVVQIGRYARIKPAVLARLIDRGGLPMVISPA